MEDKIRDIFTKFDLLGDFLSAAPYGSGHINDTFCVNINQAGKKVRYIFQRINHNIFKNPVALMENITRVTEHCRRSLDANNADASRRALTLVKSKAGDNFVVEDGNYWRCYLFIENARTYDVPKTTEQIYQAARAFGNFQSILATLKGKPLNETIPDFHNSKKRYQDLLSAIEADEYSRVQSAKPEIEKIRSLSEIFERLPALVAKGAVPLRITHNDTKINNVMIDDQSGEGICVIDLDTVMPGLALYDFGDMMRTTTSPSDEDEKDLSLVGLQLPRFEALLRGYLSTAKSFLNDYEIENLVLSGMVITLTIGVRFLQDYLRGDSYFKTKYPEHNLVRCRTQIKLVESIASQRETLEQLVKSIEE